MTIVDSGCSSPNLPNRHQHLKVVTNIFGPQHPSRKSIRLRSNYFSVYSKLTKSYEKIESEYWLEGMNFRCMKRPEMDVNTGNGRITGLRI